MAKGECILYPCYFNSAYTRKDGRRVPRGLGVKAPVLTDLERALNRLGVKFRAKNHHHPSHWTRREGRVVAEWKSGKNALIRKVAQKLGVLR
jgi:signal recognition particle subunit SRP19